MADRDQLQILRKGVQLWNDWRIEHPEADIDLSRTDLSSAVLNNVNLKSANLSFANLSFANFKNANLSFVDLSFASISGANLNGANLKGADLRGADFSYTNLSGAALRNANLKRAILVGTNLSNADLEGCSVFGVSAWALTLDGASQKNIRITRDDEPTITVDDLEVAQFIYLVLNNQKLRAVINTITTKAVLILGNFKKDRKAVLEAIREELRQRDYLPIIFDFDQPSTRDLTETISTLAHMARFIIADITDPRSVPHELYAIVPHLPSVPVKPILLASERNYATFEHFARYHWVLETYIYESSEQLIADLKDKIISPSEAKAKELQNRLHASDENP